jgi:hypothetical protein
MTRLATFAILFGSLGFSLAQSQTPAEVPGRELSIQRYVAEVQRAIRRYWLIPAGLASDAKCRIEVLQSSTGKVERMKTLECASEHMERSVIMAIRLASPLPVSDDPRVFRSKLVLEFRPEYAKAPSNSLMQPTVRERPAADQGR